MTISLNAVTLSSDLLWVNEFQSPRIGQSIMTTIGGETVVHTDPLVGGREVTLSAERRGNAIYGFYTRQQILDIETLEQNGSIVPFVYGTQFFNIIVKAGSIRVEALLPAVNQGYDDYYIGQITLLEV
jgi:hypothetical protein